VQNAAATMPPETGQFGVLSMICLLLFIGATGKSAQIPLFVWLPDAMEGPTPVSALIHAATMVTAGVYMVGRNAVLFSHAPLVMEIVAIVGVLTALMAASIALVQYDIKRVLAYSTVSQLGYMFTAMGVGAFSAGAFHLMTHAFFKALLFLGSGSVIHAMGGEQDMRRMGGLKKYMPVTRVTMVIGALAIAGVPPLSGFFSKDEILWGAFAAGTHPMPVLGVVGLVVALLTAYYSGRLLFMTFFGESRVTEHARHHLHESPAVMTLPLVVLALLSIVGGFVPVPAVVASVVGAEAHGHAAHAPLGFMALALGLAVGGLAIAWVLYGRLPGLPMILAWRLGGFYRLVRDKFRVDELYGALVVGPLFALARFFAGFLDPRIIDGVANGAAVFVGATAGLWRRAQTGNVQHYALSFLVGALVLLGWYAGQ